MIWKKFAKAVIVLEEYNYIKTTNNPYHDTRIEIMDTWLSPHLKDAQAAFVRALVFDLPNPGHVLQKMIDMTSVIPVTRQYFHLRDVYDPLPLRDYVTLRGCVKEYSTWYSGVTYHGLDVHPGWTWDTTGLWDAYISDGSREMAMVLYDAGTVAGMTYDDWKNSLESYGRVSQIRRLIDHFRERHGITGPTLTLPEPLGIDCEVTIIDTVDYHGISDLPDDCVYSPPPALLQQQLKHSGATKAQIDITLYENLVWLFVYVGRPPNRERLAEVVLYDRECADLYLRYAGLDVWKG